MKNFFTWFFTIIISAISIFTLVGCDTTTKKIANTITDDISEIVTPLKLTDTMRCSATTIDTSTSSYIITPAGFDFDKLNKQGYKITIKVTYDVYYTKDWNVLWDIGYLGAPKYEVCILDNDLIGNIEKNITAPSKSKTNTITYTTNVVNLIGGKVILTFSSDNIQNKIHFDNIVVNYDCFK